MKNIDFGALAQFITALGTFLGVVGGILVSLNNGKKADINAAKLDVASAKLDENTQITKDVHAQTEVVKAIVAIPSTTVINNAEQK